VKTIAEREQEYAAARERIYGKEGEGEAVAPSSTSTNGEVRNRQLSGREEEIDTTRRPGANSRGRQDFDVVYASVVHPLKPDVPPTQVFPSMYGYQQQQQQQFQMQAQHAQMQQQPQLVGPNMQNLNYQHMSIYPNGMANGYPPQGMQPNGFGPVTSPFTNGMPQPPYMPPGHSNYQWQNQQNVGRYNGQVVGAQQMPNAMPQMGMPGYQQWYGNGMGVGNPQMPHVGQMPPPMLMPAMSQHTPMPALPQGLPYSPAYYNQPQQYPSTVSSSLAQPTPMRPGVNHSSTSSSISSRSYQDYSRPHSRGSTTSTRSGASGVRMGARYATDTQPGARQKPMKAQCCHGMTGLGLGDQEKKKSRGQSSVSRCILAII
jgi:hypothetical protein